MATTHIEGPLVVGTIREAGPGITANIGYVPAYAFGTINQNSTSTVSVTITLPANSRIIRINPDVTVAYDSGTSATFSAGIAAEGTEYVASVNAKTAGLAVPSHTAAQRTAMLSIGTNTSVVCTVIVSGATTVGQVSVSIEYVQL